MDGHGCNEFIWSEFLVGGSTIGNFWLWRNGRRHRYYLNHKEEVHIDQVAYQHQALFPCNGNTIYDTFRVHPCMLQFLHGVSIFFVYMWGDHRTSRMWDAVTSMKAGIKCCQYPTIDFKNEQSEGKHKKVLIVRLCGRVLNQSHMLSFSLVILTS